ncbi:serine/threonine-protein kinase bur1 [Pseudozyma hubeiensis SY62]|uniref:Serine/threonine-protein kinase bur1 n=1 Tax=Pseudozyma hubeiensis (strain SY62) TaxID=1305764 RepID=R9P3B6_PSEHS|nr:serine/threonine-protein kinase bur1 [Pseudozyma hubeiensis SY62]GAC95928.1 serine/threonine-protein kinase bur1 [Pseudozyma hubeiensis SY62]
MTPPSSQAPSSNGGFRIAGVASQAPSASASASASASNSGPSSSLMPSPANAPQPQPPNESPKSPVKLDREKHTSHRVPPKHAHAPSSSSQPRHWPQRSPVMQSRSSHNSAAHISRHDIDDDEEEGAIDDSAAPKPAAGPSSRPPPPKTPPHHSNPSRSSATHGRNPPADERKHHSQTSSYQPRSPSTPRRSYPSQSNHLRSPSPPASFNRSTIKDHDISTSRPHPDDRHRRPQPDRADHDVYRPSATEHRARDERYPAPAGARLWGRAKQDLVRASDDDDRRRDDRGWGNDRRGAERAGREWDRDYDRRYDREERDRGWDQHRNNERDRRDDSTRDRDLIRNGRDREVPPASIAREQRYAGWSPTPPDAHHADPSSNGNHDPRPPSRMGRAAPPPPLLSHPDRQVSSNAHRDPDATSLPKRPRSRSPPAGLLKRKANFSAVVPPALPSVVDKDAAAEGDNVAPGAPLPPKIETMQSPVLPASSSRLGSESLAHTAAPPSLPGSALNTVFQSSAANSTFATSVGGAPTSVPVDANYQATCEALDDFTLPSVRLSCLPRKQTSSSSSPPTSGRERRRARGALIPLNQRKFVGCSSLDDYEISIKLGQGTFGEVLKGRQILTGTQVALKKVTIHDAKDGLPITALREIKLLKKLKHPSIVPVIDMAVRASGERGKLGDVYMVEPYMDHDLNGMLENPSIRLEHSQIKLYMKQLLEGTLYLHKNRILHRDMKAANLLINNKGQLQIADFGLARAYRDPGQSWKGGWSAGVQKYTNMVVTRWYRPPELLAGERRYGPPIDMWGIGCILAEMITGRPLFKGTSEINQLELISKLCGSPNETNFPGWNSLPGVKDADPSGRPDANPEVEGRKDFGAYPRKVNESFRGGGMVDAGKECADLIDKLLVLDPRKRLGAKEALEHEWFWEKPWVADGSSLPRYEHSKEIDRVRRDWKPVPVPVGAQPVPTMAQGGGGRPAMQQQQSQQQQYGATGAANGSSAWGYPRPGFAPQQANGGAGQPAPNPAADAWEAITAGPRSNLPPAAAGLPSRPYPSQPGANPGAGGRHPFPNQQANSRFPHPNQRQNYPFPGQAGPRQQQQQQQQGNLPARAVQPPHGRGPNGGAGGNPYA